MKIFSSVLASTLLLAATFTPAFAVPIVFTHAGSPASGTLDGVAFGPSSIVIKGYADTDDRQVYASGYYLVHTTATIEISGLGLFTFLTPTSTFFNDGSDMPGFGRPLSADLFDGPLPTPELDGWDMTTSVGPFPGTLALSQWNYGPVETSGGVLFFPLTYTDGYFSAAVGVPERGTTGALLAGALVALGGLRRRLRA